MERDALGPASERRHKRMRSVLSTLAWGIALTINERLAPLGAHHPLQPELIVGIFRERGFIWLPHETSYYHRVLSRWPIGKTRARVTSSSAIRAAR